MSLAVRENAAAAVRAGITHILFAVRPEEDARAIDAYLNRSSRCPALTWSTASSVRRRSAASRFSSARR